MTNKMCVTSPNVFYWIWFFSSWSLYTVATNLLNASFVLGIATHSTWISSFNHYNRPIRQCLQSPYCRWRIWGTKRLGHLPKEPERCVHLNTNNLTPEAPIITTTALNCLHHLKCSIKNFQMSSQTVFPLNLSIFSTSYSGSQVWNHKVLDIIKSHYISHLFSS